MWRCNTAGFDTTQYGNFTFAALPTQSGYKYLVQFYNTSGTAVGNAIDPAAYTNHDHGVNSANWTVYSIPLTAFGVIGTVGGVSIKDNSGAASNVFYLSAIGFWGNPAAGILLLNETWATATSVGTFPASTTYSSRWSGVGDTGQTRNVQNSPVNFNGGNVAYFVCNPAGCTGAGSTCTPTGSMHSMVVYAGPQANFVAGKPYVLGFALFMSGGWAPNGSANGISGGFDIIFQFHPSDQLKDGSPVTKGPYANPMMTIQPINGVGQPFQLNIIGRTSTTFTGGNGGTQDCINSPVPACFSPGSLNRNVTYDIGVVTLGTWLGFGFEFQISTLPDGSDGYIRGYFSPGLGQPFTQAFNDVGANDYYSDARTPYMTGGEYHGEGSRSIPPGPQAARQIAYGPVRFGRVDAPSNCTLLDVIPWAGNN